MPPVAISPAVSARPMYEPLDYDVTLHVTTLLERAELIGASPGGTPPWPSVGSHLTALMCDPTDEGAATLLKGAPHR